MHGANVRSRAGLEGSSFETSNTPTAASESSVRIWMANPSESPKNSCWTENPTPPNEFVTLVPASATAGPATITASVPTTPRTQRSFTGRPYPRRSGPATRRHLLSTLSHVCHRPAREADLRSPPRAPLLPEEFPVSRVVRMALAMLVAVLVPAAVAQADEPVPFV